MFQDLWFNLHPFHECQSIEIQIKPALSFNLFGSLRMYALLRLAETVIKNARYFRAINQIELEIESTLLATLSKSNSETKMIGLQLLDQRNSVGRQSLKFRRKSHAYYVHNIGNPNYGNVLFYYFPWNPPIRWPTCPLSMVTQHNTHRPLCPILTVIDSSSRLDSYYELMKKKKGSGCRRKNDRYSEDSTSSDRQGGTRAPLIDILKSRHYSRPSFTDSKEKHSTVVRSNVFKLMLPSCE